MFASVILVVAVVLRISALMSVSGAETCSAGVGCSAIFMGSSAVESNQKRVWYTSFFMSESW